MYLAQSSMVGVFGVVIWYMYLGPVLSDFVWYMYVLQESRASCLVFELV